jgi:hypothetical protein
MKIQNKTLTKIAMILTLIFFVLTTYTLVAHSNKSKTIHYKGIQKDGTIIRLDKVKN